MVLLLFGARPVAACVDCNGDQRVTVADLVVGVNIVLSAQGIGRCAALDANGDGRVAVNELIVVIAGLLSGCTAAPTPTATSLPDDPTPTPTTAGGDHLPPIDDAALLSWLQDGSYRGWQAESAIHPRAGPHFGRVRAFVNDALFASLSAGAAQHPATAAAVKELYGGAGDTLRGWAVMRKLQPESDFGQGWYWYEYFNGGGSGGIGNPVCTGCHSVGRDFIRIPFPLQ